MILPEKHISLTRENFEINDIGYQKIFFGDLLDTDISTCFDIVYSFGTLHHISHEQKYLKKIHRILNDTGELRVALYSKYSFFNFYMFLTWLFKNNCHVSFNIWQGKVSDNADFSHPITIKIRSKKQILNLYQSSGFIPVKYYKRGFVKKYIPFFGRFLAANGITLNALGSILGWYHIFIFKKKGI